MKKLLLFLLLCPLSGLTAATAVAAGGSDTGIRQHPLLMIQHEFVGCHSWSLNGGTYGVVQTVRLREGDSLQVVNRDMSTHRLIKTAGGELTLRSFQTEASMTTPFAERHSALTPRMPIRPEPSGETSASEPAATGEMAEYGAGVEVTFSEAGRYEFITQEGSSYFPGAVQTLGPVNMLTLHVLVFPPLDHPLP